MHRQSYVMLPHYREKTPLDGVEPEGWQLCTKMTKSATCRPLRPSLGLQGEQTMGMLRAPQGSPVRTVATHSLLLVALIRIDVMKREEPGQAKMAQHNLGCQGQVWTTFSIQRLCASNGAVTLITSLTATIKSLETMKRH